VNGIDVLIFREQEKILQLDLMTVLS